MSVWRPPAGIILDWIAGPPNRPTRSICCTAPRINNWRRSRNRYLGHPAVDLAAPQGVLKRRLIHAEVVSGRGLDIAMSGQFFDEHDVSAVVQQAGAERMPEQVRGELFGNTAFLTQPPEQFGHVIPAEPAWLIAGRRKQRRKGVFAHLLVPADPGETVW